MAKEDIVKFQFKPGQSGNPGGKPKGAVSMKTWAKNYLATLPPEERIKFLNSLPKELVWRMAEGNPDNKTDITSDGKQLFNDEQKRAGKEAIKGLLDEDIRRGEEE